MAKWLQIIITTVLLLVIITLYKRWKSEDEE